jgi:hypothetical protein
MILAASGCMLSSNVLEGRALFVQAAKSLVIDDEDDSTYKYSVTTTKGIKSSVVSVSVGTF